MSETTLWLICSGFNLFCLLANVCLVGITQKLTNKSLEMGSEILENAKIIIKSVERKNNGRN